MNISEIMFMLMNIFSILWRIMHLLKSGLVVILMVLSWYPCSNACVLFHCTHDTSFTSFCNSLRLINIWFIKPILCNPQSAVYENAASYHTNKAHLWLEPWPAPRSLFVLCYVSPVNSLGMAVRVFENERRVWNKQALELKPSEILWSKSGK